MMQTLVGRDGFARGMTLYFERHDGQAVTCDDFAQAIADANPEQRAGAAPAAVQALVRARPARRGVTARGRYDAPSRTYTLGLEQSPGRSAGPAGQRAVRHPAGDRPARRATAARCGCGSRTSPRRRRRPSALLVLDEAEAFFTFVDVDEPPVPSLLRGFSAPVMLVDGLGDAELLVLLRHDSDPFNRWEAGPAPGADRACSPRSPATARRRRSTPPSSRRCARVLRDPTLDPAFKELVLTLPSEIYVAEQLDVVDPQRIHAAREAMREQLAHARCAPTGSGPSKRTR